MIEMQDSELSPAAAEYLLSIRFREQDVERMNELSELARRGALTPEQELELDGYIHVGNMLAILQSKARRTLPTQGTG